MLTHPGWATLAGLRHGFGDREAPRGPAWSVDGQPVLVPRQVHGARVVAMTAGQERPDADAVLATAGRLVGVVTADCVPVLLVDRVRRAAAAVHAGWRGAAAGVLENAVERLAADGSTPDRLEAVIGPAIGGCCYEVGEDVLEAFRARSGDTVAGAWRPRGDRWHLDLRAAVRALLERAGVRAVTELGPCTACVPAYHSYRRDGAAAGRQLSFVGWA